MVSLWTGLGITARPTRRAAGLHSCLRSAISHVFSLPSSRVTRAAGCVLTRPSALRNTFCSAAAAADVSTSTMLQVERIPVMQDNYVWLLVEEGKGKVAVVDPAEFGPVDKSLQARGLKLDYIIKTHHHMDHVGGNKQLIDKYGCQVIGAKCDASRIPGIGVQLGDNEEWAFGSLTMQCIETPGHTLGHVVYYVPEAKSLFAGDTLFVMGCGRLFEGSPAQMFESMNKIKVLPADTAVYCAHEYTQANAKFAISVNPNNTALQERVAEVAKLRSEGIPTVPGNLGQELKTNPFLRSHDPDIKKHVGLSESATELETFAATRKAKDNF